MINLLIAPKPSKLESGYLISLHALCLILLFQLPWGWGACCALLTVIHFCWQWQSFLRRLHWRYLIQGKACFRVDAWGECLPLTQLQFRLLSWQLVALDYRIADKSYTHYLFRDAVDLSVWKGLQVFATAYRAEHSMKRFFSIY